MKIFGYEKYVSEKLNIQPINKERLAQYAANGGKRCCIKYTFTDDDIKFYTQFMYDMDDVEIFQRAIDEGGVFVYDKDGNYYTADGVVKFFEKIGTFRSPHNEFLKGVALGVRHHKFTHSYDITFDASEWQGDN